MFNVGNNLLSPPLSGVMPGALPGSASAAGYGSPLAATLGDGISAGAQPPGAAAPGSSWWGNNPGGFINQFMSTIFAAFTQMAQYLTSAFGQPPWGGPQPPFPQPNRLPR